MILLIKCFDAHYGYLKLAVSLDHLSLVINLGVILIHNMTLILPYFPHVKKEYY